MISAPSLQALPTKSDIEALILRIKEAHSRDIQEVKAELHAHMDQVDSGEALISSLAHWVSALECSQVSQATTAVDLQLNLEDMEGCSRRNYLRLRGLPEATLILRKAWEHGEVGFDGATIKILLDLSRATLQRRSLLRPVLDLARQQGCTYRWGYPLVVIFRYAAASFTLRTPAELPALFAYLGVEPVPDWLAIIPRPSGRPGPSAHRNYQPLRQQRPRRRPRAPDT